LKAVRVVGLVLIVWAFLISGVANAQGYYHIVQPGDTLWDICEKYYGDPYLWPKLWEMNPFVTNPHLLKPGDKIRLMEGYPFKEGVAVKREEAQKPELTPKKPWWEHGLDVSGLTNVNSMGYLSGQKPTALGKIISTDSKRKILAVGDIVYIQEMGAPLKAGTPYTVYECSELVNHPLSGEPLGYIVTPLGRIDVLEKTSGGLYKAKVAKNYEEFHVGDTIMTYREVSPCVRPVDSPRGLESRIVAVKGQRKIVGQFNVVYLGHGKDRGILRGTLFRIIKERSLVDSGPQLPELTIGYVLIVDNFAETSSGVVVMSTEGVPNGALLRGMKWEEAPRYLGGLPACSVE